MNMLMTAIKRGELNVLRQIVYRYDPKAFNCRRCKTSPRAGFSKLEDEVRFDAVEVEQKKIESLEGSNSE